MIPFSDPSEPNRIFPWVNITLIIANFLVFLYELSLGVSVGSDSFNKFLGEYSLIPCEYVKHCHIGGFIESQNHIVRFPRPNPYWLTLITSMFMHAGWLHLLGNMVYLWVFGDNVENSMGHFRYLIFYLLCGLGANALEVATAVNSTTPGLGASGAIAGVLGAYLVLYPRARVGTLIPITFIFIPVRLPAWILIGFWFVLQLFDGVATLSAQAADSSGGVAYWAHVGGFVTGVVFIWVFRRPERVGRMPERRAGGG